MKIASTLARYLMGLAFTVFGMNGFLRFLDAPLPAGVAGQFIGALMESGYLYPVALLQVVSGVLFLANRYVPIALTLIGPVIVNILLFHLLMEPVGTAPGAVMAVCWGLVFYRHRSAFAGIFQRQPM